MYHPDTDGWTSYPAKLRKCKSSFAVVCINSIYAIYLATIYLCGGSDGHVSQSFESLDLVNNQWKLLEGMKYKREEHGFALGPDGKLYAVGGFNGKRCLKEVERYDIAKQTWEEIAPMNYARRSLCVTSLSDGIYAIGGYEKDTYLNIVEKYNIKTDTWDVIEGLNRKKIGRAHV